MTVGTAVWLVLPVTVCIWELMRNRLIFATNSLRGDLIERSKNLLESEHLEKEEKRELALICQAGFIAGTMWRVALVLPLYVLYALIWNRSLLEDDDDQIQDIETRKEFRRVNSLAILSAMTLSPFFAVIVLIEMLLVSLLLFVLTFPLERPVLLSEEWVSKRMAPQPV